MPRLTDHGRRQFNIDDDVRHHRNDGVRPPTAQLHTQETASHQGTILNITTPITISSDDAGSDDDGAIRPAHRRFPRDRQLDDISVTGGVHDGETSCDISEPASESQIQPRPRRLRRGRASWILHDPENVVWESVEDEHQELSRTSRTMFDKATEERSPSETASEITSVEDVEEFKTRLQKFSSTRDIERLYPQSLWPHRPSSIPIANEQDLVDDYFRGSAGDDMSISNDDFEEIALEDFVIYRDIWKRSDRYAARDRGLARFHPGKLESLHNVATDHVDVSFCVDGFAVVNGRKYYLEKIPIHGPSIGGYFDKELHSTEGQIWLQSVRGAGYQPFWYRLGKPSSEYEEIWQLSTWVADFAKHFFDFLHEAEAENTNVKLQHFQSLFLFHLEAWHGTEPSFKAWHEACGYCVDFRKHVARFASFLKHQYYVMLPEDQKERGCETFRFNNHDIWGEICPGFREKDTTTIDEEDDFIRTSKGKLERTVTTDFIGSTFEKAFPKWGKQRYKILRKMQYSKSTSAFRAARMIAISFPDKISVSQVDHFERSASGELISMAAQKLERHALEYPKMGTVDEDLDSKVVIAKRQTRKSEVPTFQYALVHDVVNPGTRLRVIWLALPSNIPLICAAFYPIGNELFMLDECNCDAIDIRDVVASFKITMWSDRAKEGAIFFVREKYLHKSQTFVSGQYHQSIICNCRRSGQSVSQRTSPSFAIPPSDFVIYKKAQSLSLFAGCGLLDWGLESKGTIETATAIDFDKYAVQTHIVNSKSTNCKHICDSVNRILKRTLFDGSDLSSFDVIVAGSPCKGFSRLNGHRTTMKAHQQCSLVAATLSFVETYLPLVFIMENVPDINGPEKPNVCQQAVACLVALGYQVQKWQLDSSEHGSCQKRKRLFIVASAPSFPVLAPPKATHGVSKNLRPLETVANAMDHLAAIHNDTVINVEAPDHLPIYRFKCDFHEIDDLSVVAKIPVKPRAMNMYKALKRGAFHGHEKQWAEEQHAEALQDGSPFLRRIDSSKSFPTVTTFVQPKYGRTISCVHWEQDRVFSLEEARIAMGCPKNHVLIGTLREQLRQMGNAVPFELGKAIGRSHMVAWRKYQYFKSLEILNKKIKVKIPSPGSNLHSSGEDQAGGSNTNQRDWLPKKPKDHHNRAETPKWMASSQGPGESLEQANGGIDDDLQVITNQQRERLKFSPRGPAQVDHGIPEIKKRFHQTNGLQDMNSEFKRARFSSPEIKKNATGLEGVHDDDDDNDDFDSDGIIPIWSGRRSVTRISEGTKEQA